MPTPLRLRIMAIIALVFGLLTIFMGGQVLFIDGPARAAAGHTVPFILWFNFIAGFFYCLAGAGLWLARLWAGRLSMAIAMATMLAFAALGVHILMGGAFEMRTLAAMVLRSLVWLAIAFTACRTLLAARAAE